MGFRGFVQTISRTRIVAIASPAAGADVPAQTVPAGKIWEIITFHCIYTCSAQVANRQTNLVFLDDLGRTILRSPSITNIAANNVGDLAWFQNAGPGGGSTGPNAALVNGIPFNAKIPAGGSISTLTNGIQTLDQISAILMEVLEYDSEPI